MNTGKKQALFLVDCGYSKSDAVYSDQRYRTICRACTKILFFLSKFPDKEHLRNVQWNYKLFSTQTLTTTPLRHESTHFQDIRSDNLESFFKELKNSQIQSGTRTRQVLGVAQPVQLLYNALAAAVQDFAWDAPEIISPIRRLTSQKHSDIGRTRRRTQSAKQPTLRMNYIFICGTSPENELELREFCRVPGGERLTSEDGVPCPLKDYVQKKLLPSPLLAQLESRGIAVHWVHFSNCGTFNGHVSVALHPHSTHPPTPLPHTHSRTLFHSPTFVRPFSLGAVYVCCIKVGLILTYSCKYSVLVALQKLVQEFPGRGHIKFYSS